MTRSIRIRLLVFAFLAAVAVGHAAVRYVGIGSSAIDRTITVSVDLPESGGLYAGSEVTMRGEGIGTVEDVVLSDDGVEALLEIDADKRVPVGVHAAVHNRSAVGEQYLDLVPTGDGDTALEDGDAIPREATSVPVPEEQLIVHLEALVRSVSLNDLRTVVRELGKGFAGTGEDLQALIDGSTALLEEARRALPATLKLTADSLTVLQTQVDGGQDIKTFARYLRQVSDTVAQRDPELRRILADAGPLATELTELITTLGPLLPQFLTELSSLSGLTGEHLRAVEQALVAIPHSLAAATNSVRGGRAQFSLAVTPDPRVCQTGYLRPDQWRSPYDTEGRPIVFDLECAEAKKLERGTQYAPQ